MIYIILITLAMSFKLYFMSLVPELDTQPLFFHKLIISDLGFISILLFLLGINYSINKINNIHCKIINIFIKILIIFMVLFYMVDVIVIMKFYDRFYIDYFFTFWNSSIITSLNFNKLILFPLFIILYIIIRNKAILKLNRYFMYACILFGFTSYLWTNTRVENRWSNLSQDLISVNLNASFLKTYTHDFKKSFLWKPDIKNKDVEPLSRPKNIFLIPIESWSYKHSKYFSKNMGKNWTPALDKLAKDNIALTNLYANGYMTEHGLFALLTGMLPFFYSDKNNLDISMDLASSQPSLIKILNKHNYKTTFFSGAPKDFLHKDVWLNHLGIKNIIDNNYYPDSEKKYIFNSVSDLALFNKVSTFLHNNPIDNFIIIENVQTHVPFYVPSSKNSHEMSEERAFRYTDKVIASFIKKHNNPDNLFIVLADHRCMQSTTNFERQLSGNMAASRIPAFIIWNNNQFIIEQAFSQVDIYSFINRWITGKEQHSLIHGQIYPFNNPKASQCQFFTRGDNRSYITIKCGEKTYNTVLNADNTFIKERISSTHIDELLNWVNWSRLRHLEEEY